jgi:hypothetical protein
VRRYPQRAQFQVAQGARSMDESREAEEAEARRKRIECRHQTGHFFDSIDDMRWLYFDLTLRSVLERSEIERQLENFIREPIHESLWWDKARNKISIDDLTAQAARYIDRPLFHCTALRDFFIARLTESLLGHVHDPLRDRPLMVVRKFLIIFLPLLAFALYVFVNWWIAAALLLLLAVKGWGWLKEIDNTHRCKFRNRRTRDEIIEIVVKIKRGGFDEPTIIHHLELFDVKIPPVPTLIYIYGCPYLLGSDKTGIQEHTIPIPDVLYALLRLPRRNVCNEISAKFSSLNESNRAELTHRWRKFVDCLLSYDEPATDQVKSQNKE